MVSDNGLCDGGQTARRASSETGTRTGVKQNTEADPSSMSAENSQLFSKLPEHETGSPNVYVAVFAGKFGSRRGAPSQSPFSSTGCDATENRAQS